MKCIEYMHVILYAHYLNEEEIIVTTFKNNIDSLSDRSTVESRVLKVLPFPVLMFISSFSSVFIFVGTLMADTELFINIKSP